MYFVFCQYARGKGKGLINPIGFKIALELYTKCGCSRPAEVCFFTLCSIGRFYIHSTFALLSLRSQVPFSFGVRVHGESKLTGKVIINYLSQLWQLYQFRYPGLLPIIFLVVLVVLLAAAGKILRLF